MEKQRRKIVIIPVLLLVIIMTAVCFGTYMTREVTIRRMEESLYIQACNQASTLRDKIEGKFALLNGLGTVFNDDNIGQLNYVLTRLDQCATKTDFINVDFAYPNGLAYRNDSRKMDVSDRWYFSQCLEGKQTIEYLDKGKLVDEVRIVMAVPIMIDGQVRGVLIGNYDEQQLQDLFETVNLDISEYSFICNSKGEIIEGTDYAKAMLEKHRPGILVDGDIFQIIDEAEFTSGSTNEIREQMKNKLGGEISYVYGGETHYTMFEPVGISDWYVVTVMQESLIQKEAMKTARILYVMLGVVMLAVVCIMFYLVWRERRQVRQEKIKSRELRYILEHDGLTGILVEKSFQKQMAERLEKAEPEEYGLVYMDIYKFKLINEMFGLDKGDKVLCVLAARLQKFMESCNGICGRISGDKFIAFVPNRKEVIDEFYTRRVENEKVISGEIYVHYGIYIIKQPDIPVARMIGYAQLAQKAVKGNYDNCVNFYDEQLRQQMLREQEIINTMAQALDNGEFIIYLQPQYNYRDGSVSGSEALVRWNNPEKGLIPPGEFIPVFETNGFITRLDEYIWEQACRTLRGWIDEGYKALPISVNVSRADLLKGGVAEKLQELIEEYALTSDLLCVEITESAYMDNPQQLIQEINRMREKNFIVEMDDFGSGYSSLNMLKDVPINVLKTDLKFLSDTGIGERKNRILDNVVHMAHQIGLTVVAEGVETKEQADYLIKLECEIMQGYYFSKPVPVEEFEKMVYRDGV